MKIGDLCTYAPKSSIKAGDAIIDGRYMFFTSSSDENKRYSDYQLDCEGIIMGTGGNATLHYYNGKFATSTDCVVLLSNETIRCKYLYYFFLSNMDILESGFKGAGLKHTNKNYINSINISSVPSFEMQDRVIKVLDKVQSIIDKRQQQLEKLDELVKSRFVEMFGHKNFPIIKLEKICNVGSSKRIYQCEQSTIGIPFLRISDLNERIDTGNKKNDLYIPVEKYEELLKQGLVPKENDILVTSRGTLGKCYIVSKEDCFYFQDGMISWLSNIDERISSKYISYLFSMPMLQKQIEKLQTGSTVSYLSIAMLNKLNISAPPIELQNQFAAFVEQIDKSKFEIKQSLEKLELLKKALMQKYFG